MWYISIENTSVGGLECTWDVISCLILLIAYFGVLNEKDYWSYPIQNTLMVHAHKHTHTSINHMTPCTFVEMDQYSG